MNAPRPDTPHPAQDQAQDERLRHRLRAALARAPADGLQDLEARALAQWRRRNPAPQHPGPLAALQAGWRHHPVLWKGALLALGVAGVLLAKPLLQPDPGIDELMQPAVLSLMSMGEL